MILIKRFKPIKMRQMSQNDPKFVHKDSLDILSSNLLLLNISFYLFSLDGRDSGYFFNKEEKKEKEGR